MSSSCSVVVACRVSPLQKSQLVRSFAWLGRGEKGGLREGLDFSLWGDSFVFLTLHDLAIPDRLFFGAIRFC